MGSVSKFEAQNRRLDSWKEIAGFFGCDERTVKRWEKERGLPVHRLPGTGRGKVFAYADELTDWLHGVGPKAEDALGIPEPGIPEPGIPESVPSNSTVTTPLQDAGLAPYEPILGHPAAPDTRKVWFLALPILALILAAFLIRPHAPAIGHASLVRHPANSGAEELYLKGRFYWGKRTADSLSQAVDYFTQAIVHDPNYAPAYVGLADCYNLLREYAAMPDKEAYPRALSAAKKAVELDDTLAEAHRSLAFGSYYWNWDAAAADREFQRAIELDPNDATTHQWYGNMLQLQGRTREGLAELGKARKLDPSSRSILADTGNALFSDGQHQAGIELLQQMEEADPDFLSPHRYLAWIYTQVPDYPKSFVEAKAFATLRHDSDALALAEAEEQSFATGGVRAMSHAQVKFYTEKHLRVESASSVYPLAAAYARLGKKQDALHFLQLAYAQREVGMLYLKRDPDFNSMRDDPAFRELLAKVAPQGP